MTQPGESVWSEVGGPPKGMKYVKKAKAGEEVSNITRHEPGPPSYRPMGQNMIIPNHPQVSNVHRGKTSQTGMRPRVVYEAEVGTGREQLPPGPAGKRQMSRRHYKLTQRQAEPEGPRQPNHQPQWHEATSHPAQAEEEEQKADQQVPWHMDNLEEMTVPAFSHHFSGSNNGPAINYSL